MASSNPLDDSASLSLAAEQRLITRILAGERDEYRHLVQAYQEQVVCMVYRQVGERDTAEEIAQESFIKGYLNLSKFKGEARFSTWITRIALNQTSSYFASSAFKQKQRSTELLPEHERATDPQVQDERLSLFQQAIAELQPLHRTVLVLCGIEGKSYEEAAGVLEIPVGTVRSRLNKARLLMRDIIETKRAEGGR